MVLFILSFCLVASTNLDALGRAVDSGFKFCAQYFGFSWQLIFLINFLVGIAICLHPKSKYVIGQDAAPEFPFFQWSSMIMCTLLAGGGIFWAAGEPIAHFLSPPPYFGVKPSTVDAIAPALAQSFLHWGFLAWAILGSLASIVLMHYHYEKGLPLAPRTLLYPVFGDAALRGPVAIVTDFFCIMAVIAGTVGPIGFFGLQAGHGMNLLFGVEESHLNETIAIIFLCALYTISAITGIARGVQLLSRINIILTFFVLFYILFFGPTSFVVTYFFSGMAEYVTNLLPMAMYRGDAGFFGDPGWLSWWTIFFWGWFIGYAPMMAIFITRISRGRSIRSIILMVSVFAPILTNMWFTILGGSGIAFELEVPGTISQAFGDFDLPAALFATLERLPLGYALSILVLFLSTIFVATTGDSMTYVLAVSLSKDSEPSTAIRVFLGVSMGLMAIILLNIGEGSISKLQSFIVITALPVSVLLIPCLWEAALIVLRIQKSDQKS